MDESHAITAVGATVLTMLGKFALDLFKITRKSKTEDNEQRFDQLKRERKDLQDAQVSLRQDLMAQILDLRGRLLEMQKSNTQYAADNAALSVRVADLTAENHDLRKHIGNLEKEVAELKRQQAEHRAT